VGSVRKVDSADFLTQRSVGNEGDERDFAGEISEMEAD
jgi:hypothetical protein